MSSDDLRAWVMEDDAAEPAADDALLADEEASEPRAARRPNLSPEAFFVFSMMAFFVTCLLSLVILLVTGRIMPG